MAKVKITKGKYEGMNACADKRGVIAALAVDHRGNLLQEIARSRGEKGTASAADMLSFKSAVTKTLTPYASAILLDPEYGLGAISSRSPNTGVMLAYEKSGYDFNTKGRLPDLLQKWSIRRLISVGAQAIKILLYYNPFDDAQINLIKQVYIERVGAECMALDVPFFLEPLVYDDMLGDEKRLPFARKKQEYVARAMQEFSKPQYGVDVLKVEMPINPTFMAGSSAFTGEGVAYSHQEAIEHFRNAANATTMPCIFLSGGATDQVFCEMLELTAEANIKFSGVLCGRAIWQEGIPIFANEGEVALTHWLEDRGAQNIQAINNMLARCTTTWCDVSRGKHNIQIIEKKSVMH